MRIYPLFVAAVHAHDYLVFAAFKQFCNVETEEGKAALVPARERLVHVNFGNGKSRPEFQIIRRAYALVDGERPCVNARAAPVIRVCAVPVVPGMRQRHRLQVRHYRRAGVAFEIKFPADI